MATILDTKLPINSAGILRIIEYISYELNGYDDGTGSDVKVKYLAEEEKHPYWWIEDERCWDMESLDELREVVENEGFFLQVCGKGFWVTEKKYKRG
jgi:hypothetical protein